MAVLLFECSLDPSTMSSIHELRLLRLEVLRRQISEIDGVLDTLLDQGVLLEEERGAYKEVILEELKCKSGELEQRLKSPDTVHLEELELYIDVLHLKTAEL